MDALSEQQPPTGKEVELLRSPKTLLIDHDIASLGLAGDNLRGVDFTTYIKTASSLEEADKLILEERKHGGFDLVICPLRFPGEEGAAGFSFAQRVQGGEYGRPPFVVIRTNNVDEAEEMLTKADWFTQRAMMVIPKGRIDKQGIEEIKRRELAHQMKFTHTSVESSKSINPGR